MLDSHPVGLHSSDHRRLVSWPLAVILAIFVSLALVYSLLVPLGEASDESEHFALIRFIAENSRPPVSLAEQQAISAKGDASPLYHTIVALLTQHVDVTPLPELPDPRLDMRRAIPGDRLPFKGLYHTEDEGPPLRGIVLAWHLARLVSIPLGAITILIVYLAILALEPGRPYLAAAAAGVAAFVPRFVIGSAIVGDDNLVLPLIALALYRLVRLAQGHHTSRDLLGLGVIIGLAAVAKYHSLVLLPEVTLVLAWLAWKEEWGWRRWLGRVGLVGLGFILIAGWWFAWLLYAFNQVAGQGWLRGLLAPFGDPVITEGVGRGQGGPELAYESPLGWLDWAGLIFSTFWFRLGRGHVITNPLVNGGLALVTLLAAGGMAARAWRRWPGSPRASRGWRPEVALLLIHLLIYLAIITSRYVMLPTRETAQGRHFYPALIPIAFFLVMGLGELLKRSGWSWRTRDRVLAAGLGSASLAFSLLTLPLLIVPVYYPYLPIQTRPPDEVAIQFRRQESLAEGVNLVGYDLAQAEVRAGQALPVTLYWRAGAPQEHDYLTRLCLEGAAGPVTCWQGYPADGRYPARAWEPGYLVRDEVALPVPGCLPPGDYNLTLAVQPLRLDSAAPVFDDTGAGGRTILLQQVRLQTGQSDPADGVEVWLGPQKLREGELELKQLRQALTVITYRPATPPPAGEARLVPAETDAAWPPVAPPVISPCPGSPVAAVYNFIASPAVRPASYTPQVDERIAREVRITVRTRPRTFTPPGDIQTPLNATLGAELNLLGYEADLSPRYPGETVDITLYWQARSYMARRYVGSFHLLDYTMTMKGQIDHVLGNDYEYPNTLWAPGEVVSQVYRLPVGRSTPAGLYTVEFGVYHRTGDGFDFLPVTAAGQASPARQLSLGQVRILDPAQEGSPAYAVEADLGQEIRLLGYDLDPATLAAGQTIRLALYWQAARSPTTAYTVFTQLIGPDGQVWAQQDNQPQGGRYPTTAWAPQDRVIDRYELQLRPGAPPGAYRLLVGMYDLATGQRLPASDSAGHSLPDQAISLTTLTLE